MKKGGAIRSFILKYSAGCMNNSAGFIVQHYDSKNFKDLSCFTQYYSMKKGGAIWSFILKYSAACMNNSADFIVQHYDSKNFKDL